MVIGSTFKVSMDTVPREVIDAAEAESNTICNSSYTDKNSYTGRPRSNYDILKDCLLGKIGEFFLKSRFNYVDDCVKWHDLISPDGERTEVKTWRKQGNMDTKVESEIHRLKRKKNKNAFGQQWFFSTKLVVITYDEENEMLEIYGTYDI